MPTTSETKAASKTFVLQWLQNEHDGVSNHRRIDFLHNRFFRRRSKKKSTLHVTGLCEGNSPVNFPHKGPVKRKRFPLDDVIMGICGLVGFEFLCALYQGYNTYVYHIYIYIYVYVCVCVARVLSFVSFGINIANIVCITCGTIAFGLPSRHWTTFTDVFHTGIWVTRSRRHLGHPYYHGSVCVCYRQYMLVMGNDKNSALYLVIFVCPI